MTKALDISGMRFGNLVANSLSASRYFKSRVWKCICDCGMESEFPLSHLTRGTRTACGFCDLTPLRQRIPLRGNDWFWARVKRSESYCWEWTGSMSGGGYGTAIDLNDRKTRRTAHRIAYELEVGPIPVGFQVDHLCLNAACVRPDHLEAVQAYVNVRRSTATKAVSLDDRRCPSGHPWIGDSYFYPSKDTGKPIRYCRACKREQYRNKTSQSGSAI